MFKVTYREWTKRPLKVRFFDEAYEVAAFLLTKGLSNVRIVCPDGRTWMADQFRKAYLHVTTETCIEN